MLFHLTYIILQEEKEERRGHLSNMWRGRSFRSGVYHGEGC